jgi:hypothetical protein
MLHTFNATAYEIADYNFNNLKAHNLVYLPEGENNTMKFVEVKLSEQENPYFPSYNMYNASIFNASPGTEYNLYFDKKIENNPVKITINATGTYYINTDEYQLIKV